MAYMNGAGLSYNPRRLRPSGVAVVGPAYDSIRFVCNSSPGSTVDASPTIEVHDGSGWTSPSITVGRYHAGDVLKATFAGSPNLLRRPLSVAITDYPFARVKVTLPVGRYLNSHAGFIGVGSGAVTTPTVDPWRWMGSMSTGVPTVRGWHHWQGSSASRWIESGLVSGESMDTTAWIWFDGAIDSIDPTLLRFAAGAGAFTSSPTSGLTASIINGSNGQLVKLVGVSSSYTVSGSRIRCLAGAVTRTGQSCIQHDTTVNNDLIVPILGWAACPSAAMFDRPIETAQTHGAISRMQPWLQPTAYDTAHATYVSTSYGGGITDDYSFPADTYRNALVSCARGRNLGIAGTGVLESMDQDSGYMGFVYSIPGSAQQYNPVGRYPSAANIATAPSWGTAIPAKVGVADGTITSGNANAVGARYTTLYADGGGLVRYPGPNAVVWNPSRDEWGSYTSYTGTTSDGSATSGVWLPAASTDVDGNISSSGDFQYITTTACIGMTGWTTNEAVIIFPPATSSDLAWKPGKWNSGGLVTDVPQSVNVRSASGYCALRAIYGQRLNPSHSGLAVQGYSLLGDRLAYNDGVITAGDELWTASGTVPGFCIQQSWGGANHWSSFRVVTYTSYLSDGLYTYSLGSPTNVSGFVSAAQTEVAGISVSANVQRQAITNNPVVTETETFIGPYDYTRYVGLSGFSSLGSGSVALRSASFRDVTIDSYSAPEWDSSVSYNTNDEVKRTWTVTSGGVDYTYQMRFYATTTTTIGAAPESTPSEWDMEVASNGVYAVALHAADISAAYTSVTCGLWGVQFTASGLPTIDEGNYLYPTLGYYDAGFYGYAVPLSEWPMHLPACGPDDAYPGAIWSSEPILSYP